MFSGQREPRQAMVELRARPLLGRMACFALRRKIGRPMIRVLSGIERRHVARGASRRGCLKLSIHMA